MMVLPNRLRIRIPALANFGVRYDLRGSRQILSEVHSKIITIIEDNAQTSWERWCSEPLPELAGYDEDGITGGLLLVPTADTRP